MAFQTGTATNYLDLYDQFVTFLTTTLPLAERWTVLASEINPVTITNGTRLTYLRAPGLSGTDEIFSILYAYESVAGDYYNIAVRGSTGYLPADIYSAQPGVSAPVYALMWNSSIPYWFIGNGRRAMIVAKVSTVYQVMHMGFITPYASPNEYPYPHFVGGTWGSTSTTRWSESGPLHRGFFSAGNTGETAGSSGAKLRVPDGSWVNFQNYISTNTDIASSGGPRIWPHSMWAGSSTAFAQGLRFSGTGYALYPCILWRDGGSHALFGEIEGVFAVSGFANAAENLINISGVDYLVVPSIFRSTPEQYAAFRLS